MALTEEDHGTYIKRKEANSIRLFEKQMLKGIFTKPFNELENKDGSFSDFDKSVTVKSDAESSKDTKATPDKSTKNSKVPSNKINKELSDV